MNHGRGRAGLISAGGVAQSFLVRLPSLLSGLGPVKAASLRVARRISNALRAGHAVECYSDLEKCPLIWLAVPDAALDRVIHDLAAQVSLEKKMIVLCGSDFDSLRPGPLRASGARIASLNVMDAEARVLVAEGNAAIIRELRTLAIAENRKLIEIRSAAKCMYLASVQLATRLVLPWMGAALESFRAAGFSRAEAAEAAERLGRRALRAYGRAGRKAWSATASTELRGALDRDFQAIDAADPRLAALYSSGIAEALKYFGAD